MGSSFFTIIYAVLTIFLIIELGLTAYCVHRSSSGWPGSSFSSIIFMLFNTLWTIFISAYVAVVPFVAPQIFNNLIAVVLEGLTALLWFSGSIAMGVWVPSGAPAATVAFGVLVLLTLLFLFIYDMAAVVKSRRCG